MVRMGSLLGVGLLCLALAPAAQAKDQAIQLRGTGAQIYTCTASASGFAWSLKAPDAQLLDSAGKEIGKHFAGPSWRATDGSTVVGELLITSPAPSAGAIAWLVLRAKAHEGSGLFAHVAYIARTETSGGVAPTAGCDAAHLHAETRVPYSATYTFFPGVPG